MSEKRNVIDDILQDLNKDDASSYIFAAISSHPEGIGFNKLLKEIRHGPDRHYRKMAKTTLSLNLKILITKNLVERTVEEDSYLKLKPTKYQMSPYFRENMKGLLAQTTLPEEYNNYMKDKDGINIARIIIKIAINHISDCLAESLQYPDNIANFTMKQLFYNLEAWFTEFRKLAIEKNQVEIAIDELIAMKV
jgi:hypothetical protein